jgi:transposase-like protein
MLSVVADKTARAELHADLDELARQGARRMLAAALEAEVDNYLAAHAAKRNEGGRRLVVRNGHARQREVLTAAGAVPVRAPRVDDRQVDPQTGERARFRSVILPPWCRRSPKVAEVLPLLYLHGLSTGDFVPALAAFFGSAAGLSAAAVGRLLASWQADYQAFGQRDLSERDYVYVWAALRDVFPATRHQRDWVHKAANVLGCLPKAVHAGARRALAERRDAPDRDHAQHAIGAFARDYGVKWPKAVAKVVDDAEELLCFFDFPAAHWVQLKTSNPIWVLSRARRGGAIQVGSCPWQTLTLNPIGAERLSLTRVVGSRHLHAGTGSLA